MATSRRNEAVVRKRAPMACERCRKRKVRCDVSLRGSPCTNCHLDRWECKESARRKRVKGVPGGQALSPDFGATGDNPIKPKSRLASRSSKVGYIVMQYDPASTIEEDEQTIHRNASVSISSRESFSSSDTDTSNLLRLDAVERHTDSRRSRTSGGDGCSTRIKSNTLPSFVTFLENSLPTTLGLSPSETQVFRHHRALELGFNSRDFRYLQLNGPSNLPMAAIRNATTPSYVDCIYPGPPKTSVQQTMSSAQRNDSEQPVSPARFLSAAGIATSEAASFQVESVHQPPGVGDSEVFPRAFPTTCPESPLISPAGGAEELCSLYTPLKSIERGQQDAGSSSFDSSSVGDDHEDEFFLMEWDLGPEDPFETFVNLKKDI